MIQGLLLQCAKILLNMIYLPFKLFKTQNKAIFISRQFNHPNLDFKLIKNELCIRDPDIKTIFLCKKLKKGVLNKVKYIGFIFRCLYHLATSSYCIVDTYIIQVSMLKHKKSLTVVQIWHALGAIKKFGHQTVGKHSGCSSHLARAMNMHKNYNYVIASSPSTAEHYCEAFQTDKKRIKIIGMPRIDYIRKKDPKMRKKILSSYPSLNNKPNILYVPTFRKDKINPMQDIYNHFDFDNYNLVIKYHQLDKSKQNKETPIHGKAVSVYDKKFTIFDLYKICDAVVTDYSSAAFEASLLDKPVYFYVYDYDEYMEDPGLNIELLKEMPNCTFRDFEDIMDMIKNDRYDLSWIRSFRKKYITVDLNKSCTESFVSFLLDKDQTKSADEIGKNTYLNKEFIKK